jgi:mannose-1-phosphate guanylyltransferase
MRELCSESAQREWGLVLAGGEGERLRPLTRALAGDERPKQFCALLGRETPLEATWRRVGLGIHPRRTLTALTRHQERFYGPIVAGEAGRHLVVQPANRGTAAAILYAALRIADAAPTAILAVFPSDHWVSDDAAFMRHVGVALAAAHARPDLVVLLGIEPRDAETAYGWIEPGEPLASGRLRRVRRFWEKPEPALAERLFLTGCLWNSLVLVAGVPALLSLLRRTVPALVETFAALPGMFHTAAEPLVAERIYAAIQPADFSRRVLAAGTANLAVLPVRGVDWSDLGDARRLGAVLAERAAAASAAGAAGGAPA